MGNKRVSIIASRHSCMNLPVSIPVDNLDAQGSVILKDKKTGREIPAQVDGGMDRPTLCFIVDDLKVGDTREYQIVKDAPVTSSLVELSDADDKVECRIGGELFTSYHYAGDIVRPFLYPVIGPGGKGVTRNFPMVTGIRGETDDHKHHRSIWVAHGDINGVDNWSEDGQHGYQVHREFIEKTSGPVFARIRCLNDWTDHDKKKMMEEARTITIYNLPDTSRIIDLEIVFRMTEGDMTFGDTKEGGIASVRVATTMDGDKGGLITNAYGGITEAENWGKPSHWCDYSGTVDGRTVGVSIFDNPDNFRYPTRWHVRDYGLFSANPFALSAYTGDPNIDGSHTVKAGEPFAFSYRLYIHDGDARTAGVGEQFHGYINPPSVEIK